MPRIVFFDEGASPQKVLSVTGPSVDEGPFNASGRTDFVVHPDLSALEGVVPRKYWKHLLGSIVEYTAQEKTDQDTAEAARDAANVVARLDDIRSQAAAGFDGFDSNPLLLRAFAETLKDEINTLRALHGLPNRTLAQLRTAIAAKVNDGTVDS